MVRAAHIGDDPCYLALAPAEAAVQAAAGAVQFDTDCQLLALHGFQVEIARRTVQDIAVVRRLEFQLILEQRIDTLGAGQPGKY
ncbi:hypothetical protein D3C72_2049950 [compost metagenome]